MSISKKLLIEKVALMTRVKVRWAVQEI